MSVRGRAAVSGLAVVLFFALPLLPEIFGTRRLIFRDAQVTHWPWRRVATASLARGEVPFIDAQSSGGQPLLANPNAVLLYPTFLFESFLPPASAFNLHYLVHVIWAFLGARLLARRLDLSEAAGFLAGIAFGFSGMMLSYGSAFMNSAAAAAWLPWCAAAAMDLARSADRRQTARAAAALGLALGLQLLGGEPVISLLTVGFAGLLALCAAWGHAPEGRAFRLSALCGGGLLAGALALALAAPLLLPLRQVYSLTYRGQHLFSQEAFGAAPFRVWRFFEWLLPRFHGNPSWVGVESSWLHTVDAEPFVYIWSVTFGVVPFTLILLAALRREFWSRGTVALTGAAVLTLLFSFGFALPFYRFLFEIEFLRRLRYPIKFYLLTTLLVALLAGRAAEILARSRPRIRDVVVLVLLTGFFASAWIIARPGGELDRRAWATLGGARDDHAPILDAFRGTVRSDAILGTVAVLLLGLVLRARVRPDARGYALGLLTLVLAVMWGLPLFVSGPSRELARPPELLQRMVGPGRVYAPDAPRPRLEALEPAFPHRLPVEAKMARVRIERLFPATGSPFGVHYLFEIDPDGSYGYYNRIFEEATSASNPVERDRLLRLFGARWVITAEREPHPLLHAVTGFSVGGERLALFEVVNPIPELRWAARAYRRSSLSATIDLLRSGDFDPATEVALPGREDRAPTDPPAPARLSGAVVRADSARVEVAAEAPGHVVFSRNFFPAWKARVDQNPVRVLVADGRDLAVAVPPGRHSVEIWYDRRPFRLGVALQATAMLAAGALIAASRRRGSRDSAALTL